SWSGTARRQACFCRACASSGQSMAWPARASSAPLITSPGPPGTSLCFNTRVLRHYFASALAWISAFGINSLLAILGVAIGCANIIALIAVTDTAQHQTFSILRDVGANTIFVLPFAEDKETMSQRSN